MNKIKLNTNVSFLKLIAVICMLIDHIGYIFFPDIIILRIIGRISFPLFIFSTFIGYFKTKDIKKYIIRLLILALISQPIYIILFNKNILDLNIIFALLFELILLFYIDNKKYIHYLLTNILILLINIEYGIYIVLFVPMFYFLNKDKLLFFSSFLLMNILLLINNEFLNFFSILSLPFLLIKNKINIKINKWFYYIFYPFHLLIIYIIKIFFLK